MLLEKLFSLGFRQAPGKRLYAGAIIKEIRTLNDWTEKQLAEVAHTSQPNIHRWEADTISISLATAGVLAGILGAAREQGHTISTSADTLPSASGAQFAEAVVPAEGYLPVSTLGALIGDCLHLHGRLAGLVPQLTQLIQDEGEKMEILVAAIRKLGGIMIHSAHESMLLRELEQRIVQEEHHLKTGGKRRKKPHESDVEDVSLTRGPPERLEQKGTRGDELHSGGRLGRT